MKITHLITILSTTITTIFLMTGFAFAGTIMWEDAGGGNIYWDSGNVGIGTTDPSADLEIRGTDTEHYFNNRYIQLRTYNTEDWNRYPWIGFYAGGIRGAFIGYGVPGSYIDLMLENSTNLSIRGGKVGINTTNPGTYHLAVNGKIRAKEIKVESGWSDFVFEEGYELPSLEKVESYIKENKHLPDIPSAKEVKEKGLAVSDMLAKQMQKIEELTLYMIQLKKENELRVAELKKRIAALEKGK